MIISIINLIFYLFVVTMNFLANSLPLNGQTSEEISDKLDVLFTPAGYVFSIWGFIYFLLAI
jgi:translocator protein